MTQATGTSTNAAGVLIDSLIASNRGDRNAFTFADKRYSYQDVAALMNRAGNMMKGMGVRPGAAVLVVLPGSPAFVASVLGAMKAGAMAVLGPAPGDATALRACVAACGPALVIVHQNDLASASVALEGLRADAVIVVGGDGRSHKSFVDEIRGQSSWLSAESVSGEAPALAAWTGSSIAALTHAQLAALRDGGEASASGSGMTARAAACVAMLRAFAKGETATLA